MNLPLFSALFLILTGCQRTPAKTAPSPKEEAFIREGMLLKTYCSQGVDFRTFGDQLARTQAAFDVAFPQGTRPDPAAFRDAVTKWQLARLLWKLEAGGARTFADAGYNLEKYNDMRRLLDEPPLAGEALSRGAWIEQEKQEIKPYVREGMAKGSDAFSKGFAEK